MFKKILSIVIASLLCLAIFSGCGKKSEGDAFAKDGKSVYSVVTNKSNYRLAENFVKSFKEKTGILLNIKYDSATETEKEILFGETERGEIEQDLYVGYQVKSVGSKIYFTGTDNEQLIAAGERFVNDFSTFSKIDGTSVSLTKKLDISHSTDELMTNLPYYLPGGVYDIGNNSKEVCMLSVTANDFANYCEKLEDNGYSLYASNEIVDNKYKTYLSETHKVTVKYINRLPSLLVAIEEKGALENKPEDYQTVTTTQLTQVDLIHETNQDGMSYLYRLADGRFIAIDGGFHESNGKQASHFYDLLTNQNVLEGKPVIALWIITHPHEDHIGMFSDFIERYSENVIIEKIAMDISADEYTQKGDSAYQLKSDALGTITRMRTAIQTYASNVPILKWHGGQKITIADAEIEVLYTLSDMLPSTVTDRQLNATSTIFTITVANNKTIYLGDAMPIECDELVSMYGNYLKSDMMQLAHHGYNGATKQIYQTIDPVVGLWPSNPTAIPSNSNFEYNKWLIENQTTKELLVSGYYEFVLPLPYAPTNEDMTDKFINKPVD